MAHAMVRANAEGTARCWHGFVLECASTNVMEMTNSGESDVSFLGTRYEFQKKLKLLFRQKLFGVCTRSTRRYLHPPD